MPSDNMVIRIGVQHSNKLPHPLHIIIIRTGQQCHYQYSDTISALHILISIADQLIVQYDDPFTITQIVGADHKNNNVIS